MVDTNKEAAVAAKPKQKPSQRSRKPAPRIATKRAARSAPATAKAVSAAPSPVEQGVARLFMHGRSQAVRLPLAFRMPGDRVRVRRVAGGVLLEPIFPDAESWFAAIDRARDGIVFMPNGREQPPMPDDEDLFD